MKKYLLHRLTGVWLGLVIATVLSWRLGTHETSISDGITALDGVVILGIAFIKVRYVILDFMGARYAYTPLRIFGEIYPILVCIGLISIYWFR